MTAYIYIDNRKFDGVFTVGFYKPDGTFEPESDHDTSSAAAARVHYLNGGRTEDDQHLRERN